jgi:CheY-like chemotaxis protein
MATIMVVDDEPDIATTLGELLRSAGHQVVEAGGGLAALTILEEGQPLDLMMTDIIMPGLNGFSLARMAKTWRPRLKILYLTGYAETEIAARDTGLRYGKILRKPIRAVTLFAEVDAALEAEAVAPA